VVVPRGRKPRAYEFRLRGVGRGGVEVYEGNRRTVMIRRPDGRGVILQRVGRGGRRTVAGRDPNLRVLWRFAPAVTIDDRLEFVETVTRTVKERWPKEFASAFREAVSTARGNASR